MSHTWRPFASDRISEDPEVQAPAPGAFILAPILIRQDDAGRHATPSPCLSLASPTLRPLSRPLPPKTTSSLPTHFSKSSFLNLQSY